MTTEEALREVLHQVYRNTDDFEMRISKECYKKIITALEKQIPRRAILETSFPSGVKWWRCPVCAQNNIETNDMFCYRCGQALDWSDTNA